MTCGIAASVQDGHQVVFAATFLVMLCHVAIVSSLWDGSSITIASSSLHVLEVLGQTDHSLGRFSGFDFVQKPADIPLVIPSFILGLSFVEAKADGATAFLL